MKHDHVSISGYDSRGNRKVNQDAFNYAKLENAHVFVLADGHGKNGHEVARSVVNILPSFLRQESKKVTSSNS